MDLDTLKLHLRVTHTMEDNLIEIYKEWAEAEIKDSVYPDDDNRNEEFFKNNVLFDRAVYLLTAFYYESRYAYSDVGFKEAPAGVLNTIHKLRSAYPYES
ncbi:head-tail connector protein [Staphylococcus pseudintermedius]|nr:head-tail connector protein [Staphylococcus pseudintermedius]